MNKAFVDAIAKARFEVLEAEHRARKLQLQLDAAQEIIRVLARELGEIKSKRIMRRGRV